MKLSKLEPWDYNETKNKETIKTWTIILWNYKTMKLLKMQSWDFKTKKQRNCEKMLKTIMKLIENQIFKKKQKKKLRSPG